MVMLQSWASYSPIDGHVFFSVDFDSWPVDLTSSNQVYRTFWPLEFVDTWDFC